MFHICFAANEPYIKYNAVLITSIIKSTDTSKQFKDFFESNKREREREREREQRNLKSSLNSANAKNLGDLNTTDSSDSNATNLLDSTLDSSDSALDSSDSTPQTSLQNYKKLNYESLSDDEKSEGYVFHILSDFVSDDSRQKLNNLAKELSKIYPCEIEIHIASDEIFKGLSIWRDNYLSYFRFFIPDFIPNNLKMYLYLDVDMLVLGDLRKLWTLDLGNQVAGITQDTLGCRAMKPISKNPQKEDFDFGDFYLNSGFLLMNLEQWCKQNIIKKVCDFLSNYRTIYHDQDALSAVLCNQTITLPLEYNCLTHIYYPSLFADFVVVNAKMPYSKEQVKFALENPIILHWAGDAKPYDCEFFRVNTKGDFIGLFWWKTAWNTPFFSNELKALFATKRDNYLVCKDFGLYVASLINECSKRFAGYYKMPFVVYRAFSKFDLNRNYANDFSELIDKNMAFELISVAVRAWGKKSKLERIAKFAILPFRIYRTKNRCKKGIYKAQKGNVISRLYV